MFVTLCGCGVLYYSKAPRLSGDSGGGGGLPVVVPHNALHGRVRLPQIPELDEAIFATGDEAEGLVGIVVQVSHRETMRLRY